MQIYNTLKKRKEEFRPQNPPFVTMYVCGPTVYDFFHIGNARTFIMSDIIRRYLEYKGYKVKYVMNITDIDDKIIKKSNEEKIPFEQVSKKFTDAFFEDVEQLKILKADANPRATEHIQDIIEMISELEKKGYAYNVNGDVFFDVLKFSSYGKLSGKKIEELEAGARIDVNENKKNPLDFALWKKAKEGEPCWESPWGKGRPGWHIECSVMSTKHLGKTIDIHAGGNDLIFPHHENEIAQSEAAFGQQFVKYWIHFGFLNIQNEKMSKSLGNFLTAREILKKFSAQAIRFFFSQTYYGGPLNFSEELLASSEKGLEKLQNLIQTTKERLNNPSGGESNFGFEKYYKEFENAMDDDFNTPQAISVIFEFVRQVNIEFALNPFPNKEFCENVLSFLRKTAQNVFGIVDVDSLVDSGSVTIEDELIKILIKIRAELKEQKNYKLADLIREELNKLGIQLKDNKTGYTTYIKQK
ncbi:cysteine--tRNA ligase [Melioribacteraceae bacterium 4301-Me]|uniref:cysteine--tRNA ligase n=1 Tax=Pyranulibacter aquaticus TaxID=3163344 RepID=UPI00359B8D72